MLSIFGLAISAIKTELKDELNEYTTVAVLQKIQILSLLDSALIERI